MPVLTEHANALPLSREGDARIAVDCCPERAIAVRRV